MASAVLRYDIDEFARSFPATNRLFRTAREGRLAPIAIGNYVRSIHFLLLHTPIHLTFARDRSLAVGFGELASYFSRKLVEEDGHHHWAEADLHELERLFGVRAPSEPTLAMVALVENTRALIERDPRFYLAYILFAEYFTVVMGPQWLSTLERHCGVPSSAMTAVGKHIELDKDHVADGCRDIDVLLRDSTIIAPLRVVLRETMDHFSAFCDDLCEAA